MSNDAIFWLVVAIAAVLGVWKPRLLIAIVCTAFVIFFMGFVGIVIFLSVRALFGGKDSK